MDEFQLWQKALDCLHGFDPRIAILISTVIGLLAPRVLKYGCVWALWAANKVVDGVMWCFTTPEPTETGNRLLALLRYPDQWVCKNDMLIYACHGNTTIFLRDKRILHNSVDITQCFPRSDRKLIFKKARECRERLEAQARNLALVSLRN